MPEGYAHDEQSARRIARMVIESEKRAHIGARRRRQPPVMDGGGPTPLVLGPCGSYVPAAGLLPTDLAVAYPDGCDGPERYGLSYQNLSSGVISFKNVELSTVGPPLVLESDTWTHACASGSKTVYVKISISGLDVQEVVLTFYDNADDSVLAEYWNKFYPWQALVGGYLQLKSNLCTCSTFPYDVCVDAPEV